MHSVDLLSCRLCPPLPPAVKETGARGPDYDKKRLKTLNRPLLRREIGKYVLSRYEGSGATERIVGDKVYEQDCSKMGKKGARCSGGLV